MSKQVIAAGAFDARLTEAQIHIRRIPSDAPWDWLAAGWRDLWAVPGVSLAYGTTFAVLALALTAGLLKLGLQSLIPALCGGFLLIGPLIAVGLVALLGLSGLTRQVAIVQSAMPTAVVTGVLASEFGADAEFVTATILVSTITSVATLTVLLSLIM